MKLKDKLDEIVNKAKLPLCNHTDALLASVQLPRDYEVLARAVEKALQWHGLTEFTTSVKFCEHIIEKNKPDNCPTASIRFLFYHSMCLVSASHELFKKGEKLLLELETFPEDDERYPTAEEEFALDCFSLLLTEIINNHAKAASMLRVLLKT